MKLVTTFEKIVIHILILLIMVIITAGVVEFAAHVFMTFRISPQHLLFIESILDYLGFILLILIAIELLETIKVFVTDRIIRVEIILLVAIMAIARKIIIFDIKTISFTNLIAIAITIVSLTTGYFLIKKTKEEK